MIDNNTTPREELPHCTGHEMYWQNCSACKEAVAKFYDTTLDLINELNTSKDSN